MQDIRTLIDNNYIKPKETDLLRYRLDLQMTSNSSVLDYLKIRKNLSDETIKHFDLGYDLYRENITIPETKNGDVVNVAYLSLNKIDDKEARDKYIKEKGCENWIFNEAGLNIAKEKGGILIVSNQFDAMSAYQAGFKNVVSIPYINNDSIGMWVELFDSIPKIYISFENNKKMKNFGIDFAKRLNSNGTDKCFEIELPEDIKDLNEYFKSHTPEDFKELVRNAKPFYKYTFAGLMDVVKEIRQSSGEFIMSKYIPFVEFEEDTSISSVISGFSNIGKSTFCWNVANDFAYNKKIPVLILPIERGIKTNVRRFLQAKFNLTKQELREASDSKWDEMDQEILDTPVYFSVPSLDDLESTIIRAKKLFNIKFFILDHLDLVVRKSSSDYNVELQRTIQKLIRIGQENNIHPLIVHHIKKKDVPDGTLIVRRKPTLLDLKGSGSVKDDPEVVIMLSQPEDNQIEVDILKNKGDMGSRIYGNNIKTGKVGLPIELTPEVMTDKQITQKNFEEF